MPAFHLFAAVSVATLALVSVSPAWAQTSDNNPIKSPEVAKPGAIPMFKPPLYPWPKSSNTAPPGGQTGNTVWILPGYNTGTTVIVNNNYPAYPYGYYGGYLPYPNSVQVTVPNNANTTIAPVVVDGNGAVNVGATASLRVALTDLRRAWERNDAAALGRHLAPDLSVALLEQERFHSTLAPDIAYRKLADLVRTANTVSYRVSDVRIDQNGVAHIYATHRLRVPGSNRTQSVSVRTALVHVDNQWSLSAISVAPGILSRGATRASEPSESTEYRRDSAVPR